MSNPLRNMDPELPEGAGSLLSGIARENNFVVPAGYFEEFSEHIVGRLKIDAIKPEGTEISDDDYWGKLELEIMSRIRLDEISDKGTSEFSVHEKYFEHAQNRILKSTAGARVVAMRWKAVLYPALAAAAVVAGIFFFKPFEQPESESFASLLENTELDENYLEYFATEEDYYQLWLDEVDELMNDTVVVPPQSAAMLPVDSLATDTLMVKGRSHSAVEKNEASKSDAQKKEKVISFDDLTEDEIWEYLLESGGDEFYDE